MAAGGLHDKYFDSDDRCYSLVKCIVQPWRPSPMSSPAFLSLAFPTQAD